MSADVAPIPSSQSLFGDRYDIDVAARLPEFDTPGGEAYAVVDKEREDGLIYALVHYPGVPIRNDVYKALKSKPIANIICPRDRGVSNISLVGGAVQRLVTIFERPAGAVLMTHEGVKNEAVNAIKIRGPVTVSALKALAALHKAGFSHRSLRPTAMYFAKPGSDDVFIGECCSCPPSFMHPQALEPIESCFADDTSRPKTNHAGDFYQLGAALLCLQLGGPLWDGRDPATFTTARVNQGSFWALGGGQDVPGAMGNLIKGMMADDLGERWVAEDILDWFEGVVKTKRTTMKAWTMNRPTRFNGASYIDRRLLADAISENAEEGAKFIREMNFTSWVQMSFRDEILDDKDEELLGVNKGAGLSGARMEESRLVSRVSMFLHPQGPVRYRRLSLSLDNLGGAIADAFVYEDRDKVAVIAELLDPAFLGNLAEISAGSNPEISSQVTAIRKYCDLAKSKILGRGMERVLYEINPTLPCLSSKFKNGWIGSLEQMMRALERMASSSNIGSVLLDRHVAAFMCKHNPGLERDFQQLSASKGDNAKFNALVAEFIGKQQKRLRLGNLPQLTSKLIDSLKPTVKALKNKKSRDRVQSQLDKLRKGGDLSKLSNEMNLTKITADDAREFSKARGLLAKIDKERVRLSKPILPTDYEAIEKGIKGARAVAFVGVAALMVYWFM